MIKLFQARNKRKEIQARAATPKPMVNASMEDIQRKLSAYKAPEGTKKANFHGPSLRNDLEGAL